MQTAVINFTTEEKVKQAAQKVARNMGLSLSTILNNYLKYFVRTQTVVFSTEAEIPNQYLIDSLKKSENDYKTGRVTRFKTGREALDYLDKEIRNERQKPSY